MHRLLPFSLVSFLFSLSLSFPLSIAVTVNVHNSHSSTVALYDDLYRRTPTSIGLRFMKEIAPGGNFVFDGQVSYSYEIRDIRTLETLDIFQITAYTTQFEIFSNRSCPTSDLHSILSSRELIPSFCPIRLVEEISYYRRVILPKHRASQEIDVGQYMRSQRRMNLILMEERLTTQPEQIRPFTSLGFDVTSVPIDAWNALRTYWNQRKHEMQLEHQDNHMSCCHHINHWEVPTYMLHLPGDVQNILRDSIKPILEEWIGGVPLTYSTIHGIRIYFNGSYLLNHVDVASTHVISTVVNVDQEVDEDWPFEIHGSDGNVHHLFLKPGQMILYEGARAIHGREKKLNGHFYANVFIHFRPTEWDLFF